MVCEGKETEGLYFEPLRERLAIPRTDVEIVGLGAEITSVVEEAVRRRDSRKREAKKSSVVVPYDEVWIVIDTEFRNDNPAWSGGWRRAQDQRLKVAWSNPCVEYWLLLHFKKTGRAFNDKRSLRDSLRKYLPQFEKGSSCFASLEPHIPRAVKHAKEIQSSQWQDTPDPIDCNSGTTVHQLVQRLYEIVGKSIDDTDSQ